MFGLIAEMPRKALLDALRSRAKKEDPWGRGQKTSEESDLP